MTTTPTSATAATPPGDPLRAAKAPVGTGASPLVAQLFALALICLGAVAVQHLLVLTNAITGTSWLVSALESTDGLRGDSPAVLAVGIALAAVGLLLLPIALKPRPRKGIPLATATGAHLRRQDLRRIVESAVEGTDAVTDVDVNVTRRRIKVVATSVATADRDAETKAEIDQRLTSVRDALERQPAVTITVRHDDI
ncbi:DUF6286 domain-containing protein [Aeromicrobium alkaliterrae]|uniref:DUF6286 domain-containing protein n=1 Tax=Aeromicrobium alkaliterrae TaxID=302168 RepID=A0ABP4W9X1_9ACTN